MKSIVFTLILSLALVGCSPIAKEEPLPEPPIEQPADPKTQIDLSLKPNEAGKVMILMYHNIGPEEKVWTRTPENFLRDLTTLYDKGYRPISLSDFVQGNITTEAGKTPIVLTFDDGNLNNFRYLDNGEIDPECAVGLLLAFHESHPDFPLEATFFITGVTPFKQSATAEQKLRFLLEKGMDVGNHTLTHPNFKEADASSLQKEIGGQIQYLESFLKDTGYSVNTLALAYGSRPKDKTLETYLADGQYQDIAYHNIAVLNVGWHPAYSPFDPRFDAWHLPRVRASETAVDDVGLYNYLAEFDARPETRFISDGFAEVVTVPEALKDKVQAGNRELYAYGLN